MFFVSVPQYFSTAPLYPITRRPVDFFKIGCKSGFNGFNRCKISHQLPKMCDFCYEVEYLRKSWA